jgi:hypothetical protein
MTEEEAKAPEITDEMVDAAIREVWGDEMLSTASVRRIAVRVYLAMYRVPPRDRPVTEKVTPEMIEAGLWYWQEWEASDDPDPQTMLAAVYLAMRRASRSAR